MISFLLNLFSRYEEALNEGPVVRPLRETPEPREPTGGGDVGPAAEAANQLFMEEDEMAKWLYHCQDIGGVSESQGGGGKQWRWR